MARRLYYAPRGHVPELYTLNVKHQFWLDEGKGMERKHLCVIKRKATEEQTKEKSQNIQ